MGGFEEGGYFESDGFEEWVIDFGNVALVLHFGWLCGVGCVSWWVCEVLRGGGRVSGW